MPYKKCPRCGLNYILLDESMCKVCLAESRKTELPSSMDVEEDEELCPECGENAVKPGEELCAQCLAEQGKDPNAAEDDWNLFEEPDRPADKAEDEDEDNEMSGDAQDGLISLSQIEEEEESLDDMDEDL